MRRRLLLAQLIPILILLPLLGLGLTWVLEHRVLYPTLANEMIDQGYLVARLSQDQPEIWNSSTTAQQLLDSTCFQRPTRIGLLRPDHTLLATSRPEDLGLVGTVLPNLPANDSLGASWWTITSANASNEKILEVLLPVKDTHGELQGVIRMYRRVADIQGELANMLWIILAAVLFSALVIFFLSLLITRSITRPLKEFSHKIASTPLEGPTELFPENSSSELAELTHAYNQLQKRRMDLENMRQQMLANLIHEMGRPLGSLRTAVHALQTGAAQDPTLSTELLTGMTERIDRMGRLLDDLALIYRKLEPYEIIYRSIDVREWLQSLTPLWAENARTQGLTFESTLPVNSIQFTSDPERLAQVLSNLVSNAIKFTPLGGKVSLLARISDDQLQIEISDTGVGISPENQQHLFVPFYRVVHPSWKAPGLGLGLTISKAIIESLGGKIAVTSAPGQGSTFTVTLPNHSDLMQI
jgi:signal transduction histidine kinase